MLAKQGAILLFGQIIGRAMPAWGWPFLAAALGVALATSLAAGPSLAQSERTVLPAVSDFSRDLPRVLSDADARLYREVFALQEAGKWPAANKRIKRLSDKRLMGHLLAQRYLHPTAYRSKYHELYEWMAAYADHPDAKRIYKLALKRRPKNHKRPRAPVVHRSSLGAPAAPQDKPYRSTKRLSKKQRQASRAIKRQVRRNVLNTRLSVTEKLLRAKNTRRLLDQVEIDQAYTKVAAGWYYYGRNGKALELAGGAAKRSGHHVPLAHWIAGLAAWRLGRLEQAARHFEHLAQSKTTSGWNAASGAYWAARAHLRLRNPAEMSRWLALAAQQPRTFYGLLALRALGLEPHLDIHAHKLDGPLIARLESEPLSARALALLQVGERRRAGRELKGVNGWADAQMTRALLALTELAGMPEIAFRMGKRLATTAHPEAKAGTLDLALYPIPPWRPHSGFKIDRALIFALIRQESGFNPSAKSPDGARGLMQLMPSTASFIARDRGYRRSKRNKLFDPATNMELGQRYIAHLLQNDLVGGDLFRLAAAYNGGPGNLNKWQRRMDYKNDPLLFIESLPSLETRLFVERVLTNLWIYRMRLGQRAPSLDGIASGDWPLYVALDRRTPELASNTNAQN